MQLTIETVTLPRSTKIKVSKYDRERKLLGEFVGLFIDPKDYDGCCKRLAIDDGILRTAVESYRKQPDVQYHMDIDPRPTRPMFRVRNETGKTLSARVFTDFDSALNAAGEGTVIEWDNTTWVVNLDIDFPHDAPTPESVMAFVRTLSPQPGRYWQSRSGVGVHLIYVAESVFDADEIAAIAAYNIQRRFPNCRCEFLSRTRAKPTEVELFNQLQIASPESLRPLLSTFGDVDIASFLETKGWQVGTRLPHTECPVNPSDKAKGNTPPVCIHDDCVYCYVCNANGIRRGSFTAGRFPYAALSGKRVNTQIARCIEHMVHFGHARHVVRGKVSGETLAKKVYSALLKLKYGDDSRIPGVFHAGEPYGLVRYQGYWVDNQGSIVDVNKTSSILKSLPHTQVAKSNGSIDTHPVRLEWLSQAVDLSPVGYFPVVPIYGVQLTQFQELPEDKLYSVQTCPTLTPEQFEKVRPKYVTEPDRMSMDDAWQTLEVVFPGVNRKLIQCLIAARGCVEHRAGLPPMLFISGPTGSGKTTHVDIASAIIGDSNSKVYLNSDRDRFNNELLTSKRYSGFVNIDEIFKFGEQAGLKPIQAMESILSFTETSNVYIIHVGAVKFGHLPVFVFTDSNIPKDVLQHEQIGRRVFSCRLPSEVKWEASLSSAGINETKYLRTNGGDDIVAACDAILSDVVDTFFLTPATDFADVCTALEFKRLRDTVEMDERNQLLVELFNSVCKAKPITDASELHRFSPKGCKVCTMQDTDKLYRAFSECQTVGEHGSDVCRMTQESDLQRVLGLAVPVVFEVRKHGSKLALRFVAVGDKHRVNEELK